MLIPDNILGNVEWSGLNANDPAQAKYGAGRFEPYPHYEKF